MAGDGPITLTYEVKIKTYGKASKLRPQVGKILAKMCRLNFPGYEIKSGKQVFTWNVTDHEGGLVDSGGE